MGEGPLSAVESDALLKPFLPPEGGGVAVAVSGGPDSMALAFCLKRASVPLFVLIVEHGLRPESGEEARFVAARLETMGVRAEILSWRHEGVESRIHVRARQARYALLLGACKRHKIDHLFLAHHADDQAETVLMRLAKGSGIDGLSGMAVRSEREGITLVRPFLSVPKARLVATCEANDVFFVRDPSNGKERYARARLRRVMPLLEKEGLAPVRLADLAARAREAREALEHYAFAHLHRHVHVATDGAIVLQVEALLSLPEAVSQRVLSACLNAVHAKPYPPARAALLALSAWAREAKALPDRRSLHGCLIHKNVVKGLLVVSREASAIEQKIPIFCGEPVLWDGRWRVVLRAHEEGVCVAALGAQPRAVVDALDPALRRLLPQGRRRAALPALWRGNRLLAVPAFEEGGGAPCAIEAVLIPPFWV